MKCLSKLTTLACVLALALAVPVLPAHAGEDLNSSEGSMLMSSLLVAVSVSAPFALVSESVGSLAGSTGSNRQGPAKARRSADDTIPDMDVKAVGEDEHGDLRVHLQVPDTPEHTITLTWQQRGDNPAASFREGQRIAFQPSPQASGWLLRDDTGTALAFIPVQDSAAENHSALF